MTLAMPPLGPPPGGADREAHEITHEEFQKSEAYQALCRAWEIDPERDWDAQGLPSIGAAVEFLHAYEELRRSAAPWTAPLVAALYERNTALHEADDGAMQLIDRHGPVLVVMDPHGSYWSLTAAPYDPAAAAAAMARARVRNESPQ